MRIIILKGLVRVPYLYFKIRCNLNLGQAPHVGQHGDGVFPYLRLR